MHLEYGYITNHKSATERNRATIAIDTKWHQEIFQNHICPSWFIFSVEGNPVRRKGIKYIKWTTHLAQKVV